MDEKFQASLFFFFIGSLWNVFINRYKQTDDQTDACNLKMPKKQEKPRTQKNEKKLYSGTIKEHFLMPSFFMYIHLCKGVNMDCSIILYL